MVSKRQELRKAMIEFFQEHYQHFGYYPADFEYNDIVYGWDECWQMINYGWFIK
jgi:uncharacterized protein YecA (UPF0149 family)